MVVGGLGQEEEEDILPDVIDSDDEEDFLPDFKEYMERELKYSRIELSLREYNNCFYVDAESGEEQLGLPGRVYLNKLPEHAPSVTHYTLKEYPQRDLALRCQIFNSWAVPVFEKSSHTCVGVLEIANVDYYRTWEDKEFLGRMYDIFQKRGLRCLDGYKHCEIQDGNKNKALTNAFHELNMVYESVCKIHDLPLALTWVSCRSCNHLLQSQFSLLNYCDEEDYDDDYSSDFDYLKQVSKFCHLRKGKVAGRILSFPNLLYCSDVKQFHIDEFPLVPFARWCKLGGWFTMCLQSSYTGDELYILEFFLPESTENDENILTKLRLILGTMEKNFKTFKLASGQGLGEALSVEVIDFLHGQKIHSIQMIPATRFIPSLELLQDGGVMLQQDQQDQPSMDVINSGISEMCVVSEAQNYNLPILDSLQNGKVTTQVDSSDQQSMDPSNKGQNAVTAEQNILVLRGALVSCFDFSAKLNKMLEYSGLERDKEDFLPDFIEYMERSELKSSRLKISEHPDHSVDSIPDVCASPEVRLNIRNAVHKLVLYPELSSALVQFWAPTRTLGGRTLLTPQNQPFALGDITIIRRSWLCNYRMGMCREYNNKFYADAESGEDELGLPGRVFLNKLPEYTPHVELYTLKEYPQLDFALRCGIYASWALPVFEHSSHTCVGVLEIVCRYNATRTLYDENFLGRMYDIFQKSGLRCFDGYKHCKMQFGDKNEPLTAAAFQELKMVCESVCKIHNLPLALTWVSCRSCNDLLQSQFQCTVLDYRDKDGFDSRSWKLRDFIKLIKFWHLRKGHITGRILPFPNLLYCSDVKQFNIAESPLVPYARLCELGGWFTMCLQSGYTGDELYVLEFFLPESGENDENILTKLRLLLGTMEEYFKTFKLASGQGLGESLSVEVINFQNGQKSHSIQMIPATRCIPGLELLQDGGVMLQQDQQDQPSMDVINTGMYVVSEAQNYNLPILDSLQNGKVTKQVDSSDQQSMDPSNKGQNAVTAERNILVGRNLENHRGWYRGEEKSVVRSSEVYAQEFPANVRDRKSY
ncbi:hypothetical protein RHSIM_Rhsim02G0245200 [Rhododendron simsii]|uniref:NLP1-9 GAF domain-containing protein n=1 Tax=Rhododendron simsii TaxID=118357 RepID=A0A834HC77_RHOSS|nr:hypothetical protein RHSIM_Rhsim02G0245200 [Rhododendron simsii]